MKTLRPATVVLALSLFATACASMPAALAVKSGFPAGVPDLLDPSVQSHFVSLKIGNIADNPDFPEVLLLNESGEQPRALLVGLDARNGTDRWSMEKDPVILIMVLADKMAVERSYIDTGFVDHGKPSGAFAAIDRDSLPALADIFMGIVEAAKQTGV